MRSIDWKALPRVKGQCRLCGNAIPPKSGRSSTCSRECGERASVLVSPATQRHKVFTRDKGVCVACGCDTEKLKRVMQWARLGYSQSGDFRHRMGMARWRMSFWDMDHKVAVHEGGGVTPEMTVESVLSNLQTLCWSCHRERTKQQAGERARRRRESKQTLFAKPE